MSTLRSLFMFSRIFKLLYVGSIHGFSADDFNDRCLNRGSIIAICKSTEDHIFGYYCSLPWKSTHRQPLVLPGNSFLFKLMDNHVVKFDQSQAFVDYDPCTLVDNGKEFFVWDRAN